MSNNLKVDISGLRCPVCFNRVKVEVVRDVVYSCEFPSIQSCIGLNTGNISISCINCEHEVVGCFSNLGRKTNKRFTYDTVLRVCINEFNKKYPSNKYAKCIIEVTKDRRKQ